MDNETPAEGTDLAAVMAAIEALAAQLGAITETMGKAPADPEMMEGEMPPEDEELAEGEPKPDDESAELREQVARMSAQLAGYEADREIASLRDRCTLDDAKAKEARALYLRDKGAFRLLASALPARPKATDRRAGASPDKSLTLAERASQIQTSKGVKFSEACKIAIAEGYTTTAEG